MRGFSVITYYLTYDFSNYFQSLYIIDLLGICNHVYQYYTEYTGTNKKLLHLLNKVTIL